MTTDLFTPLELRGTELPNRLMVSPMCQYSCEGCDGLATDWHLVHLGSRAVGGAGVVMAEATAVEPRGRISPQDLGIWSAEHADALRPVAEFVRGQGAVPAIQLAHAGRKGSKTRPWEGSQPLQPGEGGWETIAPTAEPYPYDGEPPATRRMDQDDIEEVLDAFEAAAGHALDAGFEIAEVHAAHGYLLHEFLSPVTNAREDEYGGVSASDRRERADGSSDERSESDGGFEGRTRLVREVVERVRGVWPDDKPVFVRVSATDWLPGRDSWDPGQTARLADDLAALGVDLVDVSSGGVHPDQQLPHAGPNYQVPLAEHVREESESGVAVGAVGGITTPEQADAVVRNGRADMAIVGRQFLRDPYFGLRASDELGGDVEPPIQYRRAF